MSTIGFKGRSFAVIERDDLKRLARIAKRDRLQFFAAHPDWAALYADRFLGVALCQGAALHFVTGLVGIQDFDVYSFFAAHPARRWYAKRNKHVDFGVPKFGRSLDRPDFIGRRVDLLARSLPCAPGDDLATAIREWLHEGKSITAQMLANKAVVLLSPLSRIGEVIWPRRGGQG